jgi:hypothetical protein
MNLPKSKSLIFKQSVNLGDVATVIKNESVYEGKVTFISLKGINVALPFGHRFYKWENVLSIEKPSSGLLPD